MSRGSGQASFYDFILWLVDSQGAAMWYDYRSQKLVFDEELPMMPHSSKLYHEDIGDFSVVFPEVVRHKVKVLNSYTESPATKEIDSDEKRRRSTRTTCWRRRCRRRDGPRSWKEPPARPQK